MFKSPGRIVIPADEYEEKLLRAYHETKGLDLSGDVISEDIIYNHTYKLAGQSDIIHIVDNKTFDIGDWKTNGNFRYFDPYKKYLKKPLTHLQQCEYNSYSIQLSSYAYFYELLTGMKCRRIFVIYFLRENDSLQVVPMNYLKSDIQNMLDYYQKNLVN
jgi:hypothetical protein